MEDNDLTYYGRGMHTSQKLEDIIEDRHKQIDTLIKCAKEYQEIIKEYKVLLRKSTNCNLILIDSIESMADKVEKLRIIQPNR